jgi:hypothetical protein
VHWDAATGVIIWGQPLDPLDIWHSSDRLKRLIIIIIIIIIIVAPHLFVGPCPYFSFTILHTGIFILGISYWILWKFATVKNRLELTN